MVTKLSQIAASSNNLGVADQLVGVRGGNTDLLFSGAQIAATALAPPQRSIRSNADLPIQTTDAVLNLNITAPLPITVPASSTMAGRVLLFEDVGGTWGSHTVTFNRTGTDTFDGQTVLTGTINYGWITFTPLNDGVNTGYKVRGIYQ